MNSVKKKLGSLQSMYTVINVVSVVDVNIIWNVFLCKSIFEKKNFVQTNFEILAIYYSFEIYVCTKYSSIIFAWL